MQHTDQYRTLPVSMEAFYWLSEASLVTPQWATSLGWHKHAPFIFWLVNELQPRTVVEVGGTDVSTGLCLCQAVATGTVRGDCLIVSPGGGQPNERCSTEAKSRPYESFATFVEGNSRDALSRLADNTVDLLSFPNGVDEAAAEDLSRWVGKLSARGIMLLHGIAADRDQMRSKTTYDQLSERFSTLEMPHGGGLLVVAAGGDVPEKLRSLLGAAPEAKHLFQSLYAHLGEAVVANVDVLTQRELASSLKRALSKQTVAGMQLEQQLAATSKVVQNLRTALAKIEGEIHAVTHSTSWKVSAPVRVVGNELNRLRVNPRQMRFYCGLVYRSIRAVGVVQTIRKIRRRLPDMAGIVGAPTGYGRQVDRLKMPPPLLEATDALALRVVLIAETSLPQCLKYRVVQKQRMIKGLGFECNIIKWSDYEACYEALQTHSIAIFYRVPGYQDVLDVISAAQDLGVKTFWEVDDLIFDIDKYEANKNLDHLPSELRKEVLSGVPLYLAALRACGAGIASTTGLADAMRDVGITQTYVIENGYDDETLDIAHTLIRGAGGASVSDVGGRARVRIVYGSGSKAHDADFLEVASALIGILRRYPEVEIHIAGELTLPKSFSEFQDRIFREPAVPYADYMRWLSKGDINIAPMEATEFNDAKSNIKYLEAAALKIPSVCSPRAAFAGAIKDGENGFLAATADEWSTALGRLVEDEVFRANMGEKAWRAALSEYSVESLTARQMRPLIQALSSPTPRLSILGVNIFYSPRSFGGATIIAEEMAKRIAKYEGVRYSMFTSLPPDVVAPYQTVRYESDGVMVYGVGLPSRLPPGADFENHEIIEPFLQAIRAARPDVVHIHCVQGLGAMIVDVCKREGVPVAITLHDAWWICARQFMVTGENRYCHQVKIDLDVCARCLGDNGSNAYRQHRLAGILQSADLLLSPSAFFRDLYVANGFEEAKIVVNKNGVMMPATARLDRPLEARGRIRFGFLGGVGPIKGYHLIKKVFTGLRREDYELVLVDNAINLGYSSIHASEWRVAGSMTVIPAFTQATIDDFFNGIDVLLFPTQWKESFGLAVREALVRNVWVIATDGGGVAEDIVPGVNGEILPLEDDGTALMQAVLDVLDNKERFFAFRNPLSSDIRLFDEQAAELFDLLRDLVERSSANVGNGDQVLLGEM